MPKLSRTVARQGRFSPRPGARLELEALETRALLSGTAGPVLPASNSADSNDTLDRAEDLGNLSVIPLAGNTGAIGDGEHGTADVDWYCFRLDQPTLLTVTSTPQDGSSLVGVLSLYSSYPFDCNDPYSPVRDYTDAQHPLGYRLLAQAEGTTAGGSVQLERGLAAGTYYVAVSGAGNRFFYPFLAESGSGNSTGSYQVQLSAVALHASQSDGPIVLAADPGPASVLDHSPFVLRVTLSAALDPATIALNQNVQLRFHASGTFGDGHEQLIPLARYNFSTGAYELQLTPAAPLAQGFYQVFLAGDSSQGPGIMADANGVPLGADSAHPFGADYTHTFRISGSETSTTVGAGADDTAATAHDLGDLVDVGLIQVAGAIGDDPTDPVPFNPADVDLYHFQVSGAGNYALTAEIFAGRLGSALDPALSLFRYDAATQQLQFVVANDNTLNPSRATNDRRPLRNDAALFAGLTAGDYYLAVSGSGNMPQVGPELVPGSNGIFDPSLSHSGLGGFSLGPYVLNLLLEQDEVAPQVVSVTPGDGTELGAPPTTLFVQFSEPVNLKQLVLQRFEATQSNKLDSVYIQAADGRVFYPRLVEYDATTNQATFHMNERLPNGSYQWHLSSAGSFGVTDLAGNELVGTDLQGDHVTHFTLSGPSYGVNGNPLEWLSQEPNDLAQPQEIGPLFPAELASGITITRDHTSNPGQAPADSADHYAIEVFQNKPYFFGLSGSGLPAGVTLRLFDASGTERALDAYPNGGLFRAELESGRYVIQVASWTPTQAAVVVYQLRLTAPRPEESPPPLTIGAAPAIRFRILGGGPPIASTPTPLPPPNTNSGTETGVLPVSPIRPSLDPAREFLGLGAVPTTVLYAMAAGPAGGTAFGSSSGLSPRPEVLERVFAQAPEIFLAEQLLRLTVLTQAPPSGAADSSPPSDTREPEGAPVSDQGARTPEQTAGGAEKSPWEQALDMLQNLWNLRLQPLAQPASLGEDASSEEGVMGGDTEEHALAVPGGLPEEMEMTVLVVAAALANAPRRQQAPVRPVPSDLRTDGERN